MGGCAGPTIPELVSVIAPLLVDHEQTLPVYTMQPYRHAICIFHFPASKS
jgi:hypothetical protein